MVSPRLADSAAPAAFCCALEVAGIVELLSFSFRLPTALLSIASLSIVTGAQLSIHSVLGFVRKLTALDNTALKVASCASPIEMLIYTP
ncbi:hypothetical protein HALA3H3_700013 [Halomonas sp. A3H3]|nr:hypothetical protein HALA3H3_700013 [Halomonas sp. A3H3]